MRTLKINGLKLELYDGDIETLPILNFVSFNRYFLIDSEIGGDMESFDNHVGTIMQFNQMGNTEKATTEFQNLRQNVYFMMQNVHPKFNCFVALIHSIDGERLVDFSAEKVEQIMIRLNKEKVTWKFIKDFVSLVKKKSSRNLKSFSQN